MEIMVNQDIRKFKTKDIGNFSFKEAGMIVLAAGMGYGVFYLEKNVLMMEKIQYLPMVLTAAIPLLFAFFKPQGMTFWQFITTVIKENLVDPKVYIWESDFVVEPDKFEDLYGEDYKLSDERIKQIQEQLSPIPANVKISKEEKAKIIL